MDSLRSYRQRGSPDCPIDVYFSSSKAPKVPVVHWHPEMELVLVKRGEVMSFVGQEKMRAVEGDLILVPPGLLHSQQRSIPSTMMWSIVFSLDAVAMPEHHVFQKEFVQPLQEGRLAMPCLLRPGDPMYEALLPIMLRLPECRQYAENYKMKRFTVAMGICTAMAAFCQPDDSLSPIPKQDHRAVKECMRYIHRHYNLPLTLPVLAKHVHLQPNYLCALFKEHTGQTIKEHLTQIRVDAAAFLLRNNDLPMGRVAELCGFHSESVFFRQFKKIMEITPKAYQRQQRSQESRE